MTKQYEHVDLPDAQHLIIEGPVGERALEIWEIIQEIIRDQDEVGDAHGLSAVVFTDEDRTEYALGAVYGGAERKSFHVKNIMSVLLRGLDQFGILEITPRIRDNAECAGLTEIDGVAVDKGAYHKILNGFYQLLWTDELTAKQRLAN